jgi:hypothetical protein
MVTDHAETKKSLALLLLRVLVVNVFWNLTYLKEFE